MKAVLLAAGKGTRLEPLTENIPKVMLPLAGKPLLEYIVEAIGNAGIKEIVMVVGYQARKIMDYFGDGSQFGLKIGYVEQKERLGTAHALAMARMDDDFVLVNGDSLVGPEELKTVIDAHKTSVTIGLRTVDQPQLYGVVEMDGDVVVGIEEKPENPKSNLVSTGMFAFSPKIFDAIKRTPKSHRGEYELPTSLEILMEDGETIRGVEIKGRWDDIGTPWTYLDSNRRILDSMEKAIHGTVEGGVTIKGDIHIGENTIVKTGTYIEGPVFIGKNCIIGPNAFLRDYASIEDKCIIGNSVEIKNSIIMEGTTISHLSYVGDSILGRNCNLGGGTITGNLRLDGQNVKMKFKGRLTDSGREKLGCITGDNVKTGINSIINPGRKIGSDSIIGPGVIVNEDIDSGSKIFLKQNLEFT